MWFSFGETLNTPILSPAHKHDLSSLAPVEAVKKSRI